MACFVASWMSTSGSGFASATTTRFGAISSINAVFAAAAASLLAAALDVRRTRLLSRGVPLIPEPEDEDRLREQWLDSFR